MWVPIRRDRTSKPPLGTPLRSDGHWSVQGLVGAWAFNEGAGRTVFNAVTGEPLTILIGSTWRPAGLYRNGAAYTGEVAAYGGIAPITGEHGVTLTWLGVSDAAGAQGFFNLGSASTVATCGLLGTNTGEGLRFLCRDLNVNTYNGENAAVDIVDGKPHVMSVTGRLGITNMSVSVDGQSLFNVAKPATYTPYGFNVVVFGGLHRGSPEIAASATHILGLIHAVEHSPSQIASLSSNPWQIYEPETFWIEVGGGGEIFSGTFSTSIESLIQYGVGQIGCGGGMSANAGSAAYSMGGLEGKQGVLSIGVSDLLQILSGNSGNSGNFNSQLLSLTQWLNGQHGVSGSALMYVSTGAEMVGKLGVSASIASELNAIGAYLVEIITGGKIDQMVISTKTGSAVILTATGKINITTN